MSLRNEAVINSGRMTASAVSCKRSGSISAQSLRRTNCLGSPSGRRHTISGLGPQLGIAGIDLLGVAEDVRVTLLAQVQAKRTIQVLTDKKSAIVGGGF